MTQLLIEKEAIDGKTDTMSLPETYQFIDTEHSSSIFTAPHLSLPSDLSCAILPMLGLLVSGVLCFKYVYRRKRQLVSLRDSLVETKGNLINAFRLLINRSRLPIPESTVFLHDRAFTNAVSLAKLAQAIESEKFSQPEFLLFAKIKHCLECGIDGYDNLIPPLQRLDIALKAQSQYQTLEQIELTYQGSIQAEFYRFVNYLIAECPEKDFFQQFTQQKLEESLNAIKTETEKKALLNYVQTLKEMTDDDCGLTLLSIFRNFRANHFSILHTVSALIDSIDDREITDPQNIICLVIIHYETFLQLRHILALSDRAMTLDSLAKIIQYIALDRRHHLAVTEFEKLLMILHEWHLSSQVVIGIRQEHPATEYQQPKNFTRMIPRLESYQKYQPFLTNRPREYTDFDLSEKFESATY